MSTRRRTTCEVTAHPSVVEYLLNERRVYLSALEKESQKSVLVRVDPSLGPEQYTIRYR